MPTNGLLSISLLPVNHLFFCSLIILCANMCSRSHLLLLKRKLVRQNEIKPKYYVLSFTIWLQASLSISLITLLHMMRKMQSRAIPKKQIICITHIYTSTALVYNPYFSIESITTCNINAICRFLPCCVICIQGANIHRTRTLLCVAIPSIFPRCTSWLNGKDATRHTTHSLESNAVMSNDRPTSGK